MKSKEKEVQAFLDGMKRILCDKEFSIEENLRIIRSKKRGKEQYSTPYTLVDLEYDASDVVERLKELTIREYSETLVDKDDLNPPLLFVFGKDINNRTVRNLVKWYSYITQISRMFDKGLHEEFTFCQYLVKLLPKATSKDVDLDDKLRLEFYKLEKEFKGNITLNPTQEDKTLVNVKKLKTGGSGKDEDVSLELIITNINSKFGGVFTDADRVLVEIIYDKSVRSNKHLAAYARRNDEAVFTQSIFPEVFKKVTQECYMESMDSFSKLFEDKAFYTIVMDSISKEAYKELRNKSKK